jgi:hypothetical protein
MYHDVPPMPKEKAKTAPRRLAVLTDHQLAILKSSPLFLQLLGDKVGLTEFVPIATAQSAQEKERATTAAKAASEKAAAAAHAGGLVAPSKQQQPIPHLTPEGLRVLERELHTAAEDSLRLVFRRGHALGMGVPHAIVSTVTDDPHVIHPDPNTHVVKVAVAKAQGIEHPRNEDFDYELLKYQWQQHLAYKGAVEKAVPKPFLVDYTAKFDTVDALGQVALQGLEEFEVALSRRLAAAVEYLYPLPPGTEEAGTPEAAISSKIAASPTYAATLEKAFLQQCVATVVGRKSIAGKLDLYTVTPPSRNTALITCTPGAGGTSVAAGYAVRAAQKQTYILASHFATNPWLSDQPSDLRTVLLNLARQLTPDKQLPSFVTSEVDIMKVKQFFNATLSQTSGDAGDHKTVIVMLDGIDDVDPVVLPCRSLRVGDTGADEWDPPVEVKSIQKPLPAITHRPVDTHDWIPICLSRNMRFIVTAQRDSEAHQTLELRGHDSCDAVPIGDIADNDVETIVLRECEALGVYLRDEEVGVIRGKQDARVPEYLHFVVDYIRSREESPQYTTRLTGLTQLPATVSAMCEQLLEQLEADVGASTAKALVSLLLASRWGLTEWELRALLRQQTAHAKEAGTKAVAPTDASKGAVPLLNGELFQRLLRRLRPVLFKNAEFLACTKLPMNGLHLIAHIRSRAFRTIAARRYMSNNETYLAAHHQLAHHYRRLMATSGPLESKAVREFPYHVVKGEMWSMLESQVASLQYVSLAYLNRLGYEAMRELVRAYNTLDDIASDRAEATSAIRPHPPIGGKPASPLTRATANTTTTPPLSNETIAALKQKLREYIYFVKQHNVNLVQYPHMVRQIAITCPPESCLHEDAKSYFRTLEKYPHFIVMNRSRNKLHAQAINDCHFAPTGLRIATCSDDRTVKICGLTGDALITVNHSLSKVSKICYSTTSRYVAAACQDRSLMIVDATNGTLISRPAGHTTSVKSVALSSRGRFLFTGGEDRLLKVWDTEGGQELFTVPHTTQSHHTSSHGAINMILTHPLKEDHFYTVCDRSCSAGV